jgi:hypothetical protein
LDGIALDSDRDFGESRNDARRTDHHTHRIRAGLSFEKDVRAADVAEA